ncbi:MAG: alcohol dehydrogenase catalytic domain-containing protein [Sphaerochaetaceae bacterium]|jgi:L-iditol 2-dehydrogenase|nr:alcohol dehydrogenase catalytic domain-containing protein [Sphaerochaetaceae bacterium]MDX9809804.1 alcohol dehydrogenase catalytic domain-containing protein [Sphaerochaetaceae bacterium]NLV84265.1 alcohol dehydrogenase catalytic domain-containing protein [Spirochaetales bacterium]
MTEHMKVVAVTGAKTLEIVELPRPVPKDHEVLVKIDGCAICTWEQRVYSTGKFKMPFLGGHEVVGHVVEMGAKVRTKEYKVGDRVALSVINTCGVCYYCRRGEENLCVDSYANLSEDLGMNGPGGFAEYKVMPPHKLWKLNDELPWEFGTFAEPLGCVCNSVDKAHIALGDDVVVIGGGIMGILHMMVSKLRGAKVILSEIDDQRRKLAESLGCDITFNPKEKDAVAYVKELTGGRGADVVFDTTIFPAVAAQAIEMTGKLGRCIMYSSVKPADPIDLIPDELHNTEKIITGSVSPSIKSFDTAVRLLNKGLIDPEKLLHGVFDYQQAKEAFETAITPGTYRVIISF